MHTAIQLSQGADVDHEPVPPVMNCLCWSSSLIVCVCHWDTRLHFPKSLFVTMWISHVFLRIYNQSSNEEHMAS